MPKSELGGYRGDPPLLGVARVENYDSESHSVYVRLQSWQMPFPARVLINGNCDGVRIDQQPLPIRGTWGVVAFLNGDYRNAVWLGAFVNGTATSTGAQSTDSINSSSSEADSQMQYFSHFSGYYRLLDSQGNYFSRFPDGTKVLANSDDKEPKTYRHVVDSEGVRRRVVFDDSYRDPNPPNPFFLSVLHPTGSSETITPSGAVIITSPTASGSIQQSSLTFTPSGVVSAQTGGMQDSSSSGPVLELNPLSSGVSAPQGTPAGGFQIIGQNGYSNVYMDQNGNIQIISNGSGTTIDINANGDITIQSNTGDIKLLTNTTGIAPLGPGIMSVNDLIDKFNNHAHDYYPGDGSLTPTTIPIPPNLLP